MRGENFDENRSFFRQCVIFLEAIVDFPGADLVQFYGQDFDEDNSGCLDEIEFGQLLERHQK